MTKPYRFQVLGARQIHKKFGGRALVADDMGLGKSFQSILYWKVFLRKAPVVVLCPAHLKWNWHREVSTHLRLNAEVLESRTPGGVRTDATFYVVNYDILPAWLKWLKKLRPKLVVLDEVHFIKTPTTKRSRAASDLCQGVEKVIGLSGTPVDNQLMDLYPILHILRPKLFPNRLMFGWEWCRPVKKPWGWDFSKVNQDRLGEFHSLLLSSCMIRRMKSQVLKDLPEKIRNVQLLPLDGYGRQEYEEASADLIKWLRKTSRHRANKARSAVRLVRLGYLKRLAAKLKLQSVIQWVTSFLEQTPGKLILFGIQRALLEQLHTHFGTKSVLVYGGMSGLKKQVAVDRFNQDTTCRLFLGNVHAAGTGWSAKASTVAFFELDFKPATHTQAEDRIRGIGRGVPGEVPMVYYLLGKETIEEKLTKALQTKQEISDAVIDGKVTEDSFDVFSILEASLLETGP